jgi:hypothetical protein
MSSDTKPKPSWPDWEDNGRRLEFTYPNGRTLAGELVLEDVGFDGEDEYPIWVILTDDGVELSFVQEDIEAVTWRFLTPGSFL